jgi:integrase/recombinase XerD
MSAKHLKMRKPGYTRDDRGMMFSEVLDAFIRSRKLGLGGANKPNRERTMFEYRYDLEKMVAFMQALGHTNYNDMTGGDLEKFIESYQSKDLSQSSKNKVFRSVKAFMRWVQQDRDCIEAGMQAWSGSIPKISKNETKLYIPTPDRMKAFIDSFDRTFRWGLRDYVVSCLMLDCGARIGEICFLKPSSIKFEASMVLIPQQGKTGERLVPIDPNTTVPLLRRWLRERELFTKSDWLFHNKYGGQCTDWTFDQSFRRNRIALGINGDGENITPHTMRHYFCTHYLVNGGTLHGLKAITGHESFDTLQIYVHLANQMNFVKEDHGKASPLKSLGRDSDLCSNKGVAKKKRKVV